MIIINKPIKTPYRQDNQVRLVLVLVLLVIVIVVLVLVLAVVLVLVLAVVLVLVLAVVLVRPPALTHIQVMEQLMVVLGDGQPPPIRIHSSQHVKISLGRIDKREFSPF
jgi:hypothetical protein